MSRQSWVARAGSLIHPIVSGGNGGGNGGGGGTGTAALVRTSGRAFTKSGARWTPVIDTAWGLAVRCTREQVASYLDQRVTQGFNAVMFAAVRSAGIGPTNVYGATPYSGTLATPNDSYWTHVDYCITQITTRGLVAVVLPCWSTNLVGSALTATNAAGFGQFLANRYAANGLLMWVLGGGDGAGGNETIWRNLVTGLDSTASGTTQSYAPGVDMTSTTWFNADAWIDWHAINTGSCLNYAVDRPLETAAYANTGGKPWLNIAAVPEINAICEDPNQGWALALDVRREAYWAVFAGAAGVCYANASTQVFETATLAPGGGGVTPPPPPPPPPPSGYRYYKFAPSDLRSIGTANSVQLAEFALYNGTTRLVPMVVSATNNSSPVGQEPDKAADNNIATKWLSFNKTASTLVYDFGSAVTATGYRWATAEDATERDPISWAVLASTDGATWTTLDTRTGYATTLTRSTYVSSNDFGWGGVGGTPVPMGGGGGGGGTQTLGVGGVATPAGAIVASGNQGALSISTSGSAGSPRVYDGKGFTCGRVDINANYVTVQNYNIRAGSQYGVYAFGHDITVQNNDIKEVEASGDGDLNAITVFGDNNKILYNTAINFVSGDPGDSHTDAIQCWDTSSKIPTNNLWIIGNRFEGPMQSEGPAPIHQCVMAEGPDSTDGGGGGSGPMGNWYVGENYFKDDWNQCLKFDDVDNVTITRNTFAGGSSVVVYASDLSSNVKYYSDNVVTGSYGSIGISVTSGAGPVNPLTGTRGLVGPPPEQAMPEQAAVVPRRAVDPNLAPPTNFACVWNATSPPTVTCTWTPTPGSDSTEVHEFLADPANTLKATIAYPGGSRQSRDLTGTQYLYAVRARVGDNVSPFATGIRIGPSGQSAETVPGQADTGGGTDTGGGGTGGTTQPGTGIANVPGPWTSYLSTEVAGQIRYVRTLVESRPRMEPRNTLVASPGSGAAFTPAMMTADRSSLMAYYANGGAYSIDIHQLTGSTCRAWWFNPRTGASTQLADQSSSAAATFTSPTTGEDWVLVADDQSRGYAAPSTISGGGNGGTGSAPTVNAGSDVTGHPVGTLFTRVATESGQSITSRSWRITSGPSGAGTTVSTTATLSWTPTVTGTYVFTYAATNAYGTGSDTLSVGVGAAVALKPYQIHNMGTGAGKNHYAVDIAVAGGSRALHSLSEIAGGLEMDPEYRATSDFQWVQMATRVDAPTTSGSSYARCEYRETDASGANLGFDHTSGEHWQRARSKVTTMPPDKPDVIIGQLHNSSDDVIELQTKATSGHASLVARVNGTVVYTYVDPYTAGTVVDHMIEILPAVGSQAARCRIYFNDLVIPAYSFLRSDIPGSGMYFKVGNYINSNASTESNDQSWGITDVRNIQHWHTGWATPINYFGIPEVSAGSDTSATHSTTFTRTATESGSGITTRKWAIIDGPTGRHTAIGSAAALSWSVPSSTGVYRLRYGALNANGWGIDDVLVTVT